MSDWSKGMKEVLEGVTASIHVSGHTYIPEQRWQPIETAPKDGTWFVAIREGEEGSYEVGRYRPYHWYKFVEVENGLFERVVNMTDEWEGFNNMHRMTHWAPLLPLPTPPGDAP